MSSPPPLRPERTTGRNRASSARLATIGAEPDDRNAASRQAAGAAILSVPDLLLGVSAEIKALASDCRELEAVVCALLPARPDSQLIANLQHLDPMVQTLDQLAIILAALSKSASLGVVDADAVFSEAGGLAALVARLSRQATAPFMDGCGAGGSNSPRRVPDPQG